MRAPSGIRLIATDLDGTLLRHDKTISERTLAAIRSAHAAGLTVVAATGRDPARLSGLLAATGVDYAVAGNGAMGLRLTTGEILFEDLMPPHTAAEIVDYLSVTLDGVRFEAVREHGTAHYVEAGYAELVAAYERVHYPLDYRLITRAELIGEPVFKLNVRHPSVLPDELLAVLAASGLMGFHATTSGAPFLEIVGPGVTKASGVAQLCAHLGLQPSNVMALGDARNDVELLTWAGFGVAMGNAVAEALAVADHTTATNEEDGVARAIELLLAA